MFSLVPYLVEVKNEYKQPQDLWNFAAGNSLRAVLKDYYSSNLRNYQASLGQSRRMFMIASMYKGISSSVAGTYQTGEYGFESEIYHTNKRQISYRRGTDEADMRPFHFSFYLPRDKNAAQQKRGLLILARFNTLGVRDLTIPHLQHYFSLRFQDFELSVSKVVPRVVMETILREGVLKNIRLIRKSIPADVADALAEPDRKKIQHVELVIRSKRRSNFSDIDALMRIVDRKVKPSEIFVVDSFKHENVKLEVEMQGKLRTVDLGNLSKLSSNIELSVLPGPDGHPPIDAWLKEADEVAENVALSWGMDAPRWKSDASPLKGGGSVRQAESIEHN